MIKETLYAKYIFEREGFEVLENKYSFLTYKIKDKECFLAHVYVDKSNRKAGKGTSLINDISEIAVKRGCECITASIDLRDINASNTLVAALRTGFIITMANNGVILIKRDLGEK